MFPKGAWTRVVLFLLVACEPQPRERFDSVDTFDTGTVDLEPFYAPVSATLVGRGSTWRFWDQGTVAANWNTPLFDDGAWRSGPAQLGYGDGGEATVVGFGPNASNKYITTWFRTSFTLLDPTAVTALTLELVRDDGAVVYLNGQEVLRDNMPTGAITTTTRASTAVGGLEESRFRPFPISPSALVAGTNVIAVEVHQSDPSSSDISFDLSLTAESDSGEEDTTRFAIIGDFGIDTVPEGQVADLVDSWLPDFVLTVGDNNYPLGAASTIDRNIGKYYQAYIGNYTGAYGPGSPTNRFWPSLGNHDWDTPGAAPYLAYFTLPGNERYYDFVRGPVHFFAVDSDPREPSGTTATSTQGQWLRAGLAASTSEWNVVYFHHPPYSTSTGQVTQMRWPFAEWGADLVLAGHVHNYERIELGGITYVVNGLGGNGFQAFVGAPVAGSLVRYNADYGAMRIDATSSLLDLRFVTHTGVEIDRFTIANDGSPGATTTTFQQGVSPSAAYAGTTDATISQNAPTTNAANAGNCRADGDDPSGTGRDLSCLVRWDVSAIPTTATVLSASLVLNVSDASAGTYGVYALRRAWTESQVTWNLAATGQPWATTGARGATDRTALLQSIAPTPAGQRTFPLGNALLDEVQAWVENPATNFGLILASSTTTDGVTFTSSENATTANRPRLVVTWEPG